MREWMQWGSASGRDWCICAFPRLPVGHLWFAVWLNQPAARVEDVRVVRIPGAAVARVASAWRGDVGAVGAAMRFDGLCSPAACVPLACGVLGDVSVGELWFPVLSSDSGAPREAMLFRLRPGAIPRRGARVVGKQAARCGGRRRGGGWRFPGAPLVAPAGTIREDEVV